MRFHWFRRHDEPSRDCSKPSHRPANLIRPFTLRPLPSTSFHRRPVSLGLGLKMGEENGAVDGMGAPWDISGLLSGMNYPWQKDVATQCDLTHRDDHLTIHVRGIHSTRLSLDYSITSETQETPDEQQGSTVLPDSPPARRSPSPDSSAGESGRRGRRKAIMHESFDMVNDEEHITKTKLPLERAGSLQAYLQFPRGKGQVLSRQNSSSGMCTSPVSKVPPSDVFSDLGSKRRKFRGRLTTKEGRLKKQISIPEAYSNIRRSSFDDREILSFKEVEWRNILRSENGISLNGMKKPQMSQLDSIWELFTSECIFLVDHLMVMKHVFLEPLKQLQVEGHLMFVEPEELFSNLDEICSLSFIFCKDFIKFLLRDATPSSFFKPDKLRQFFEQFAAHIDQFTSAYQYYCVNYERARCLLDSLSEHPEFSDYLRLSEQDPRCNRLLLTDLLVAPLQHLTKLPLMLCNILNHTEIEDGTRPVAETISKIQRSLRDLEEQMDAARSAERLNQLQQRLHWPTVTEIDHKAYIPDCVRQFLLEQALCIQFNPTKLIHEGYLSIVVEPGKAIEVYGVLFREAFLLSRVKRQTQNKTKRSSQEALGSAILKVYKQPMPLDRLMVYGLSKEQEGESNVRHGFVLLLYNAYHQAIGATTLQVSDYQTKKLWLEKIRSAQEKFVRPGMGITRHPLSGVTDRVMSPPLSSMNTSLSSPPCSPGLGGGGSYEQFS